MKEHSDLVDKTFLKIERALVDFAIFNINEIKKQSNYNPSNQVY